MVKNTELKKKFNTWNYCHRMDMDYTDKCYTDVRGDTGSGAHSGGRLAFFSREELGVKQSESLKECARRCREHPYCKYFDSAPWKTIKPCILLKYPKEVLHGTIPESLRKAYGTTMCKIKFGTSTSKEMDVGNGQSLAIEMHSEKQNNITKTNLYYMSGGLMIFFIFLHIVAKLLYPTKITEEYEILKDDTVSEI